MQGIFRKENTDKALKYGIYRHLPTYEKIIRNLVSFYKNHAKIEKSTMCMEYFEPAGAVKRPKTPSLMAGEGKL